MRVIALNALMDVAAALLLIPEHVPHALPATTLIQPLKHASTALLHALAAHLPLPASPAKTALLSLVPSAIRPLPSPAPLRQQMLVQPVMSVSLFPAQPAPQTSPLGATLPVPALTVLQGNTSVKESVWSVLPSPTAIPAAPPILRGVSLASLVSTSIIAMSASNAQLQQDALSVNLAHCAQLLLTGTSWSETLQEGQLVQSLSVLMDVLPA